MDEEDDETAANYYNQLRTKGLRATAAALLICAVARRHPLNIFTTDVDFVNCAKHSWRARPGFAVYALACFETHCCSLPSLSYFLAYVWDR